MSGYSASLNYPDQYCDNGEYEQNVNKPAYRVTGHQTQRPQNQQHYCNCPQHMTILSVLPAYGLTYTAATILSHLNLRGKTTRCAGCLPWGVTLLRRMLYGR